MYSISKKRLRCYSHPCSVGPKVFILVRVCYSPIGPKRFILVRVCYYSPPIGPKRFILVS